MSDAERLGFVAVDQQSRLPPSVVERFKQDNMPEAGVDSVGLPKFVILEANESADDIPDGTFIARLPAGTVVPSPNTFQETFTPNL